MEASDPTVAPESSATIRRASSSPVRATVGSSYEGPGVLDRKVSQAVPALLSMFKRAADDESVAPWWLWALITVSSIALTRRPC